MVAVTELATAEEILIAQLLRLILGLGELGPQDHAMLLLVGAVGNALIRPDRGVAPEVQRIADLLESHLGTSLQKEAGERLVKVSERHRLPRD